MYSKHNDIFTFLHIESTIYKHKFNLEVNNLVIEYSANRVNQANLVNNIPTNI